MAFFESLQNSAFTDWILGSESIWAYPTVLTLHTVGLAILVGASVVLHARLLGMGSTIPVGRLRLLYSFIWPAFAINLASGLVLFVTQAADRALQPLFYVKLGSIAIALWLGQQLKTSVFDAADLPIASGVKGKAISALVLWTIAIIAGRLMAYYAG